MKIALLSGASSIHTIRWANGLAEAGHEVHVISQQAQLEPMDSRVQVHSFPFRGILGYFTISGSISSGFNHYIYNPQAVIILIFFASVYLLALLFKSLKTNTRQPLI